MAVFGGASEALVKRGAVATQPGPPQPDVADKLEVRAGLSIGDAVVDGDDLHDWPS